MRVDNKIDLLQQYLESRLARHEVIASNIANADTPGYKSVDLVFKAHLDKAMGEVSGGEPSKWKIDAEKVVTNESTREDGNSVQLEREMAKLAQNSAEYMTGLKLLTRKLGLLKYAILGGR